MTATATREKPVLFSGPMVKAILSGHKSQTRRLLKPQPVRQLWPCPYTGGWQEETESGGCTCSGGRTWRLLFPGDVLYVRETWRVCKGGYVPGIEFRDGEKRFPEFRDLESFPEDNGKWRPSIHMPKWAARLWLEVTDVRVQRLQDISEEDAIAEGCEGGWEPVYYTDGSLSRDVYWQGAREAFAKLWDSLSPAGAKWADSPWVAAYTFRKVER